MTNLGGDVFIVGSLLHIRRTDGTRNREAISDKSSAIGTPKVPLVFEPGDHWKVFSFCGSGSPLLAAHQLGRGKSGRRP
jgi:hypothetical protein